MNKYVLRTDERMPSKNNFWGIEAATSPEEARNIFLAKVKKWHSSSKFHYLRSKEGDRARRLREDDFDVELL